jgi:hypothetical protein
MSADNPSSDQPPLEIENASPEQLVDYVSMMSSEGAERDYEYSHVNRYFEANTTIMPSGMRAYVSDFQAEHPDEEIDFDTFDTEAKEAYIQRAQEKTWHKLIETAGTEGEMVALAAGFNAWLNSARDYEYVPVGQPKATELLGSITHWFYKKRQDVTLHHPVVQAWKKVFSLDQDADQDLDQDSLELRARMGMSIHYVAQHRLNLHALSPTAQRKDNNTLLAQYLDRGAISLHEDETRQQISQLIGKSTLYFDVDGEGLSQFQTTADNASENTKNLNRSIHGLDQKAGELITDTLVLIAVNGGTTAWKLVEALNARRTPLADDTRAAALTMSSLIDMANAVTVQMNASGGMEDNDGQLRQLDHLPKGNLMYLGEAFRRLLHVSLELDSSMHDKKDEVIDELKIDQRLQALLQYLDLKYQKEPEYKKNIGQRAVELAMRGRGGDARRATGKRVHRAGMFKPGAGKIS